MNELRLYIIVNEYKYPLIIIILLPIIYPSYLFTISIILPPNIVNFTKDTHLPTNTIEFDSYFTNKSKNNKI